MAGRSENNALTFVRCRECGTGVGAITKAIGIKHLEDGAHVLEYPRPTHRTVEMWKTVRAVLEYIRTVEFYMGYLPEKPRRWDDEAVRLNLEDAREALGELALALSEGGDS